MQAHRGVEIYLYFFFNLGSTKGWVINATYLPLYPRERHGAHCIGDWVGSREGLDGYGKSRHIPHRDSIP
jgi:hypothetical protein